MSNVKFPVQIQADNNDARESLCDCMVHVFDVQSEINAIRALSRSYLHVVAWNPDGEEISCYDNR